MPDENLERLRAALSDRYAIEREIGQGGMARVLLAEDRKHHRPVAIKVMRPEVAESLGPERFLREIEIAARLTHPHILPLHDSGEADGRLYYVMPFVEGESLRDRLTREKQLGVEEALRITREVASALAYAHAHGVVHRDIKPENILLAAGHAVVSDFGIARAVTAAAGDRLTQTGIALGTAAYMSPEQATGERDIDGRTDVYSLGCVLFEMLAGEPPFGGPNVQAMIARRLSGPAPSLAGVRDAIPERLEWTIRKALARVPADRFATAEHFAMAITDVAISESAAARLALPAATPAAGGGATRAGRRHMLTWALGAVAAVAIAAGMWGAIRDPGRPANPAANRFAVLPFTIRGSEQLAYLGEGIVDLLSRNLDGADGLQAVDPGTVLVALVNNHIDRTAVDVERARAVVRQIGAGTFITGSMVTVGPTLRIQAALYEDGDDVPPRAQATVEGDTTRLLQLIDRLSAELMVGRRPGPMFRLTQTAAVTTQSLPALKAYLAGEQRLRTSRLNPGAAIADFQRAIAEDSTFALAHYRLAVAAGWAERPVLSSEAVERALASGDRLGDRDRRLLTAYAAFRRGQPNEAERQYREVLRDYPDDMEAEFQLADVLFQYNPLRGRPRGEARELFDRVLALDPGFL